MVECNHNKTTEVNKMDKSTELLRYGIIKEDRQTEEENGYRRIRVIEYENKRYLHEMFNGEVIKCCEVQED